MVDTEPLRSERSAVLPASPERAWEEVAAVPSRPRWLVELHEVHDAPAQAAAGDRFTGESRIFLHHFVGTSEVTEADHGASLSEEVYLGARMVSTWTFQPDGDGTRVHHRIDIDFPRGPLGVVLRALLGWRMRRMQRDSLANLAKVLAGQPVDKDEPA